MSGPIHANRQRSQQQLTQQEQQVIQQLQQQQTWDFAPGQTIQDVHEAHADQLIAQQEEVNRLLAAAAQAKLPAAHAQQAAPGAPAQALAPAEKTAKQLREERRHAQAARRQTPVGDHISYAMHDEIAAHRVRQAALGDGWVQKLRESGRNPDALRGFLQTRGKHMSSKEKSRIEKNNRALVEGFASQDPTLREAAFRVCVQQMRNVRLSMDMLREDYLEKHLGEALAMQEKLASFCQLMRDPGFMDFFDKQLSVFDRALLARHLNEAPAFEALLHTRLTAKGVSRNGSYLSTVPPAQTLRQQEQAQGDALSQQIDQTEALVEREFLQQTRRARMQIRAQTRQAQQAPAFRSLGLSFYSTHPAVAQLDEMRTQIARAPAQYAAHRADYDKLYQTLFRSTDTLCDLQQQIDAVAQVVEQHGSASAVGQLAEAELATLHDEAAKIQRQTDAAAGLIRFLTGAQDTLTEEGTLLAEREQLQHLVQERHEQIDEALWQADPQALVQRVQGKLKQLKFNQPTCTDMGISFKTLAHQGMSSFNSHPESEPASSALLKALKADPRFAYSVDTNDPLISPTGHKLDGVKISRMIPMLFACSYPHTDAQAIQQTLEKLMCANRYQELQSSVNRTPAEQAELDAYTPAQIQSLEQTYLQGIQSLKALYLQTMRHIEQTYGRLLSQLHPIDFLMRCGEAFFREIQIHQDVQNMLTTGACYLDPQHSADDRDFIRLGEYLSHAVLLLHAFITTDSSMENPQFEPTQAALADIPFDFPLVQDVLHDERQIAGPGFTAAEMKAYKEILRREYSGDLAPMLCGRFAPDADAQA